MHHDKDRSGKWLLSQHGDSILRLAGLTGFSSWKHVPSEVVAPRRLLDGLLEIRYPNDPEPTFVLVEIESYADADADRQVFDDIALVMLEHRAVPEVVTLVLKPKGSARVSGTADRRSRSGVVRVGGSWPVVQLWEVDAEPLLNGPDIGLVPWALFGRTPMTAEQLVARCVERADEIAEPHRQAGFLAVAEILAGFAFPTADIVPLFRRKPMIVTEALDSYALRELRAELKQRYAGEAFREAIAQTLADRFGPVPADAVSRLDAATDLDRLKHLTRLAAACPDLAAFLAELANE
jgi:hypothetical protein